MIEEHSWDQGPSDISIVLFEVMITEPIGQSSPDLPTPSQTEVGIWRNESWLSPPQAGLAGSVTACRLEAQKQVQEKERKRSRRTSKQGPSVHYLHPAEKDGPIIKFVSHNHPKVIL